MKILDYTPYTFERNPKDELLIKDKSGNVVQTIPIKYPCILLWDATAKEFYRIHYYPRNLDDRVVDIYLEGTFSAEQVRPDLKKTIPIVEVVDKDTGAATPIDIKPTTPKVVI